MPSRRRKVKRRIVLLLGAAVVAAFATAVTAITVIRGELERTIALSSRSTIDIRPGQSLRTTARQLRDAGLIGSERVFLAMALWKRIDRGVKHGRHEFEGRVTLASVLEELGRPPKPMLRVTIPEGYSLRDIARLLEKSGAVAASSYTEVACSEELRRLVGAPDDVPCAEGYLFPDTYDLSPGMSPGRIIDLQTRRYREVVGKMLEVEAADPLGAEKRAKEVDSPARLLTLASIVEKETGLASERARIASVFYNRLRIGMPLQTDPTVIYGVIAAGLPWDGNLTRAHLGTPSPWNTYMKRGLPPGPICNPGLASVQAVLEPAEGRDLYFVARGDGSHEFSANLADHNKAVRRYQLR
jgi:UPF0755 protein